MRMAKKLFGLILLLGWPGLAWGQVGGRFDSVADRLVQNFRAPIPGATITVCAAGATGTPCTPVVPTSPVTLCTDSTCAVAAPNPFLADANGNFGGWLLPGSYIYSITAPGVTGKLFNLFIPPVVPINLATQVTGTLPGANMAQVNLAASGNGGVGGTLPGANYAQVNLAASGNGGVGGTLPAADLPATTSQCTGVQFSRGQAVGGTENCATPPTFVASGASHAVGYVPDPGASAGTTKFLREDATWVAPAAGGVSEGFISFNAFGGGTGLITEELFGRVVIPSNHTLIRFTVALVVTGVTCATAPVVALWDNTAGSAVTGTSLTISNGTSFFDTGAISQSLTGGHTYDVKITTANSGCGTQPTLGNVQAVYQ